jgi:hypothetical protein
VANVVDLQGTYSKIILKKQPKIALKNSRNVLKIFSLLDFDILCFADLFFSEIFFVSNAIPKRRICTTVWVSLQERHDYQR